MKIKKFIKYQLAILLFATVHLIIFCEVANAQSASLDSIFKMKFSSDQLIEDLRFINSKTDAKTNGTSGFNFISKNEWKAAYDKAEKFLKQSDSTTLGNFFLLARPLFTLLHDDHLNLSYPNIFKKGILPDVQDKNIGLPLSIIFMKDSALVPCNSLIPKKSILLKINNIPVKEITDSILPYLDWPRQRYYRKNNFLFIDFMKDYALFYQLFHFTDSMQLTYSIPNSKEFISETFPLFDLRKTDFKKYECYNSSWPKNEVTFSGKIAIIHLYTFNITEFDSLILTYNDIFKQIKNKGSNKIIIDVRFNTGGNDLAWMIFLAYISESEVKFNCGKPGIIVKKALGTFGINVNKIDNDVHYIGKIYLLTGYMTFSSAAKFTDCIKANHLSDLIFGRETSGQASHYGNGKSDFLPNSKIKLFSSGKFFQSIDCSENESGVLPDNYINYSCVSDYFDGISTKDLETVLRKISP